MEGSDKVRPRSGNVILLTVHWLKLRHVAIFNFSYLDRE